MKKKSVKEVSLVSDLKIYLRKKAELEEMEKDLKEFGKDLFKNPELLPDTVEVDGRIYAKQTRNPTIAVTNKMIEDGGLDLDRILPLAVFSMTLVKTVFGKSGEAAVKATDAYSDELALKEISTFYKKK